MFKKKVEKEIITLAAQNFQKWNRALQTGRPEKVAEMYAPLGELFGTVSSKIRRGRKQIEGYFRHFLEKNPSGEVIKRKVIEISPTSYLDGGTYRFTLQDDNGEKMVKADYTYLWQKNEGMWSILHHHSSAESSQNNYWQKISEQLAGEIIQSDTLLELQKEGNILPVEEGSGHFLISGFFTVHNVPLFLQKVKENNSIDENQKEVSLTQQRIRTSLLLNKNKIVRAHLSVVPEDIGV